MSHHDQDPSGSRAHNVIDARDQGAGASAVSFASDTDAGAGLAQLLTGAPGRGSAAGLMRLLWPSPATAAIDARTASQHFSVAPSTIRRWRRKGLPNTRAAQLAALLVPTTRTLTRERLDQRQCRATLQRLALARGRGRVPEQYGNTGWLDPHRVFIATLEHTPLDRVIITRENPTLVQRANRGITPDGGNFYLATNRWHAQLVRHAILRLPQHATARVELPPQRLGKGHTLTWLTAATSISDLEWLAIAVHATHQPQHPN